MAETAKALNKLKGIIKKMRRLNGYESGAEVEVDDYTIKHRVDEKVFTVELQNGEYMQLSYGGGYIDERWLPILNMVEKDIDDEVKSVQLGVVVNGKTYPVIQVKE